jgi:tyrosyl-tRNA synthetase
MLNLNLVLVAFITLTSAQKQGKKFKELNTNLEERSSNTKNVLWGVAVTGKPHIGYLPHLAYMRHYIEKEQEKAICLLSDVHGYLDDKKESSHKKPKHLPQYIEIFSQYPGFNIVTASQHYTSKDYISLFIRVAGELQVAEMMEASDTMLRNKVLSNAMASDILYSTYMLTDILYFKVKHVLVGEDEKDIYIYAKKILKEKFNYKFDLKIMPMVSGVFSDEMHCTNDTHDVIVISKDANYQAQIEGKLSEEQKLKILQSITIACTSANLPIRCDGKDLAYTLNMLDRYARGQGDKK